MKKLVPSILVVVILILAFVALYDPTVVAQKVTVDGETQEVGVHYEQKMYEMRSLFPMRIYNDHGKIMRITLMVGGKKPPLMLHDEATPSEVAVWKELFE